MRITKAEMPAKTTALLLESEEALFEAEKAQIEITAVSKQSKPAEIKQLCRTLFVNSDKIDFKKVDIVSLSVAIEDIKKKQCPQLFEKTS